MKLDEKWKKWIKKNNKVDIQKAHLPTMDHNMYTSREENIYSEPVAGPSGLSKSKDKVDKKSKGQLPFRWLHQQVQAMRTSPSILAWENQNPSGSRIHNAITFTSCKPTR